MKKFLALFLLTLGISCTVCLAGCSNKPVESGSYNQTRIIKVEADNDETPEQDEAPEDDKKPEQECPDGHCGKKKMPCPKRGGKGKKPTGDDFDSRRKHGRKPPKREDLPSDESFDEAE